MDFYVIPPLSRLDLIEKGDRVFVLSQLWKKSSEYRKKILEFKEKGIWITLDNGAGDHDTTTTEADLIEICKELVPNEVIPIDVLFDRESTIHNLERFISLLESEGLSKDIEVFACPQGKDKNDWFECYRYMLDHPQVKTIGLSKITIPYIYQTGKDDQGIMEGRQMCYQELVELDLIKKPIHCLGAGDPREFMMYVNNPLMRSTDSCFTIWSAMNGIDWYQGNFERIITPKDYFNLQVQEKSFDLIDSNIDFLKKVLDSGFKKNSCNFTV